MGRGRGVIDGVGEGRMGVKWGGGKRGGHECHGEGFTLSFILVSSDSSVPSTPDKALLMLANTLLCIRKEWSWGWKVRHQHCMATCCTADPIGNCINISAPGGGEGRPG